MKTRRQRESKDTSRKLKGLRERRRTLDTLNGAEPRGHQDQEREEHGHMRRRSNDSQEEGKVKEKMNG